jgi:hypothetical protein
MTRSMERVAYRGAPLHDEDGNLIDRQRSEETSDEERKPGLLQRLLGRDSR